MATFVKVAHRGASGRYPENTRLAFEKAIELGADMIELDVQLSQDGHVVVFHDERLRRTARASGLVGEKTLQQLKKLDVGGWKRHAFRGEPILTLEETMEILRGKADLCLDIKEFPWSPAGIEIKLLFILSHYDYFDQTIFSSFDYSCLRRVRNLAPDVRIGLIYDFSVKEEPFSIADELGAGSIHIGKEVAGQREFLQQAWEAGLDVHVWTVNEIREMQKLASLGVQGLVSDFPDRLANVARKL